jgi:hypothetical protein
MYLSGLQRPDFKSINRLGMDNIEVLKRVFKQIVRFCKEMGLASIASLLLSNPLWIVNVDHAFLNPFLIPRLCSQNREAVSLPH